MDLVIDLFHLNMINKMKRSDIKKYLVVQSEKERKKMNL